MSWSITDFFTLGVAVEFHKAEDQIIGAIYLFFCFTLKQKIFIFLQVKKFLVASLHAVDVTVCSLFANVSRSERTRTF